MITFARAKNYLLPQDLGVSSDCDELSLLTRYLVALINIDLNLFKFLSLDIKSSQSHIINKIRGWYAIG